MGFAKFPRRKIILWCVNFVALVLCLGFVIATKSNKKYFSHIPKFLQDHTPHKRDSFQMDAGMQSLPSMIDDIALSDTTTGRLQRPNVPINYSCSGAPTFHGVEDLLCQQPPTFLKNYKNPCWYASGRFVCLPYFQLIGTAKSGTTDMFARMLKHPSILHNDGFLKKETFWWSCKRYGHYIDRPYKLENFSTYLTYFSSASKAIQEERSEDYITGDGNPRDMFCMGGWVYIPQNQGLKEPQIITPHLIKHMNPHVKLIVILRDPVERLYSDFFHRKRGNLTASGFDKAVRHSIAVLYKCTLNSSLRGCLYNRSLQLSVTSRIHIGFYYIFMKDWLDVFPREQILILRTEDNHKHMKTSLQDVFEFLQVRNLSDAQINDIANAKEERITEGKSKAGPMQNDTRSILTRLYRPYNEKLAGLLNDGRFLWND